ncbi:hypothetical protein HMN09_01053900 [Mycena chlorophos]|uniref:Uncharacterized protein n=1 Tax=Mycena chlorophos TaxID=658473 RepID=A0A8H6VWE2_MYCCL|nr:hypothetical protein HMN09_01053900 [Mycena chlorophos]
MSPPNENHAWNPKLILGYMREHDVLESLPLEYYAGSPDSLSPPTFVYGFGIPRPYARVKLRALQKRIPSKRLSDRSKYDPADALRDDIRGSLTGELVGLVGVTYVENLETPIVVRLFTSSIPRFADLPPNAVKLAKLVADILGELGWEGELKPRWYLTPSADDDERDYNVVSRPAPCSRQYAK